MLSLGSYGSSLPGPQSQLSKDISTFIIYFEKYILITDSNIDTYSDIIRGKILLQHSIVLEVNHYM